MICHKASQFVTILTINKTTGEINLKKKNTALYLTHAGLIAAAYAAATWLSSVFGIAYGPVQFRLSEALTVLCVFSPGAVHGLSVGCFLGNLSSPYGLADALLGSLATLLAAITGRALRNVKVKGVPLLSMLMPAVFNSVIVGAEITFSLGGGATLAGFALTAAQIAAGELAVCLLGGIPLFHAVKKTNLFEKKL